MTRSDVEALLLRMQAAFPSSPRLDPIQTRMRIEEWMATPELVDAENSTAVEAFEEWKREQDWPPTIHQFIEKAAEVRNRKRRAARMAEQQALLAEYDETIVPPEEARERVAAIRQEIAKMRRRTEEALG